MKANPAAPQAVSLERDLTSTGGFFSSFATAVVKGDAFVKLSLLWWGAGYARRKQFLKAVVMTLLEAAVIWFTVVFAFQYVPKFGTLGTVQAEQVFNMQTMKTEWNDYDDSFQILLFSVLSFVVWFAAIVVLMKNMANVYQLQRRAELGLHINTFKEDVSTYLNEKFHVTLLSLPVLGVVMFNVIPLFIVTIAVPQFVSLLLVRNFFADNGIFNGMFTSAATALGIIAEGTTLNFPWLTALGWAHVMIISGSACPTRC